jgi:hypothetical protein
LIDGWSRQEIRKRIELLIKALAKMPPAARGSFEKPPLRLATPQNFLLFVFLPFLQEAQLLMKRKRRGGRKSEYFSPVVIEKIKGWIIIGEGGI